MPLDRPKPPYLQIAEVIRKRILSGELAPGRSVPSVRDLVKEYDVAQATAQRAMRVLQAEGFVRPERGLGNIVTTELERGSSASAWLEQARRTGRVYPEGQRARILEAGLIEAPEQVADVLGVDVGDAAIRRVRITLQGDQAVSASTSWFLGSHADVAPLLLTTERIQQGSFLYLASRLGRQLGSWQDQYDPGIADETDADRLGIDVGVPVNHGRNWIYDDSGDVLEYGESVSAGRITYRGEIGQ